MMLIGWVLSPHAVRLLPEESRTGSLPFPLPSSSMPPFLIAIPIILVPDEPRLLVRAPQHPRARQRRPSSSSSSSPSAVSKSGGSIQSRGTTQGGQPRCWLRDSASSARHVP